MNNNLALAGLLGCLGCIGVGLYIGGAAGVTLFVVGVAIGFATQSANSNARYDKEKMDRLERENADLKKRQRD